MDVESPRLGRRYESPLRAQRAAETRAALIRSATEMFLTDGWAATGMRDVARAAGVAVETLYSHYPSKRALLDAVVDQAAAGDDVPVAVAERAEFRAMGRGRRAERIAAAAAVAAAINARTAPFARLIREIVALRHVWRLVRTMVNRSSPAMACRRSTRRPGRAARNGVVSV